MKKFVEKREPIEALRWNGFDSMSELVEMKGDPTNILLRHDESVVIFDNGFFLENYITVEKGDWIVRKSNGVWNSMKDRDIKESYEEFIE